MGFLRKIMGIWGVLALFVSVCGIKSVAMQEDCPFPLKIADEGQMYLYGSRYQCQLVLEEGENGTGTQRIYWNAPEIINLISVQENDPHSIPVYSMDGVIAQPIPGDTYRRINLEDREALRGEAGRRLRAVLLGSFPYLSVEELEARANEALGEGQVRQLTQGEVLTAVQQAIWTIGTGGAYEVDRNYVSIRGMSHYEQRQFVYPESLTDCTESRYTYGNIQNLYRYYLEMEPMAPIKEVMSAESFQIIGCEAEQKPDGTYTVKVLYEITGDIGSADELTLTVSCADRMYQQDLKQGKGSCVFTDLPEIPPVTVSIMGYQTGGDVYLYTAGEAGHDLIGYDESRLPVNIVRQIPAKDMVFAEKDTASDETAVMQNEGVPTFTVEVDETESKIGTVFQILCVGFFLTAIVLLVTGLLSKFRWSI